MPYMSINTVTYRVTPTATAASQQLTEAERLCTVIKGLNNSNQPVFIATSTTGTPSPAFNHPASPGFANGKIIAAGQTFTYSKSPLDNFVLFVQAAGGVGDLYFTVGSEN